MLPQFIDNKDDMLILNLILKNKKIGNYTEKVHVKCKYKLF